MLAESIAVWAMVIMYGQCMFKSGVCCLVFTLIKICLIGVCENRIKIWYYHICYIYILDIYPKCSTTQYFLLTVSHWFLLVCNCCVVLSLSVNCQNAHVSVTEMQSQTNIKFFLDIFSVPWIVDITIIPLSSSCLLISTLFRNTSPIHTFGTVHTRCTHNYLCVINFITFLLTGSPKSY